MRFLLIFSLFMGMLSLSSCTEQVDVSAKLNQDYLNQTWDSIIAERDQIIGKSWYAGRHAESFGFKRTEKAILNSIAISEFKCKTKRVGAWYSLKRKTSCHSFINFEFKVSGESKVFKTIAKIDNIKKLKKMTKGILKNRLAYGFVEDNPFSKRTYAKYWRVLRMGKVAVGMPEDYLKICWGKPLRVFNKSIDAQGNRETYVYDQYFVLLENGIVRSIHKFDS